MVWSGEHRAFVIEAYLKNGDSVITSQRLFRRHFGLDRNAKVPDKKTILLWVRNFLRTSSALKRKPPGRRRSVRTSQQVEVVTAAVLRSPQRSARMHATAMGISDRSRDEARFHLSGCVNKQNFHYWALNNPRQIHERPLHSERVTVWCAVADSGVIGPYPFEENGKAVTVTSARYVDMLRNFLQPKLYEHGNLAVWFQQDGATALTAGISIDLLKEMFPKRLISLRGDISWPARFSDLPPCDYFLWGYLKSKVYKNRPRTTEELTAAIRQEIAAIPQAMTRRVMKNFWVRLQKCIDSKDRHLDDIIFKTK
ncbi:hypothetical protein AVEN_263665-1 [Araneus ventricosus]|uniref:DUF4817 domain-containing protein n=1 Tax=Araneus ventricosus TaxID=182803 RepID=A0A4Y2ATR5_ARAVE|nr:hypothetical protein AVEN_263665-1 [Araneus ventricosus]